MFKLHRVLLIAGLCSWSLFTWAAAQNAADTFEKRLSEIERRLSEMEQKDQAAAAPSQEKVATADLQELRRQVSILSEELEKMRSGEVVNALTPSEAGARGVGPSAAHVYSTPKGVSLAGYGEMLYQNFDSANQAGTRVDKGAQLDFLRAILYAGYRFNDKILFNSEIEFEHASTEEEGAVSLEFAYLEYLFNEHLSARGGMLLMPMGLVNEFHEPNVFLGTLRPQTERLIIPSTWRENGAGIVANYGPVNARAYLVNGFDAQGFSASGIRDGRQNGSKSKATDLAFVGRLDLTPTPGVLLGGSLYHGGSGQGELAWEGRELEVGTTIYELHSQVQLRGLDLRGLFASARIDDARELNLVRGLSAQSAVAEQMKGGYLQAGYNLLSGRHESKALTPFYRFEAVDTQNRMPAGFLADPAKITHSHTLGFEFRPIYNVVIKTDYLWGRNDAHTGLNQFNVGLGYSF